MTKKTKIKLFVSLLLVVSLLTATCLPSFAAHLWKFDTVAEIGNQRFRGYGHTTIDRDTSYLKTATVGARFDAIDATQPVFYNRAQLMGTCYMYHCTYAPETQECEVEIFDIITARSPSYSANMLDIGEYIVSDTYSIPSNIQILYNDYEYAGYYWFAADPTTGVESYSLIWERSGSLTQSEIAAAGNTGSSNG